MIISLIHEMEQQYNTHTATLRCDIGIRQNEWKIMDIQTGQEVCKAIKWLIATI